MSASISIHHIETISASTVQSEDGCSPHLTINWEGSKHESSGAITFYLKDRALNDRLVEMINQIVGAEAAR